LDFLIGSDNHKSFSVGQEHVPISVCSVYRWW